MIGARTARRLFVWPTANWLTTSWGRFKRGKKVAVHFPSQDKRCLATVVSLLCHLDGDTVRVELSAVPKFDLGQIPGVDETNQEIFITIPKGWCRKRFSL